MAPAPIEMAPVPSEMLPAPSEMPPASSEMASADEGTTTTPMMSGTSPVMPPPMMSDGTSEAATNMDSMTVQSENDEAHQANLQKRDATCGTSCMVHRVRKFVYALPSCMKPHSGTCPFSRSAKIVPLVVSYPIPPPPANHIVVNDKNTVVLNAPAMPPQRKIIQINMPSQPAPQVTIYTPAPQPAITPLVVTQPAPITVTVTQMATPTPTVAAEVPVTEAVELPTSTVIAMMPTYQTAPCAVAACLETAACDQQKMESCPSAN
ncbi:hypothetical protein BC938DRAFT_481108 [Jimgerdemannia flammicorona]|uniref:Uncharacterized protein n=1 Tax=Jimgerdemannia flammicorona TaxID=994334 RepID=A0A433QGY6_9FUNG|nr:hypothetical protein BC938DRAFT_481108 [Jimgerdemannia flammicorona]